MPGAYPELMKPPAGGLSSAGSFATVVRPRRESVVRISSEGTVFIAPSEMHRQPSASSMFGSVRSMSQSHRSETESVGGRAASAQNAYTFGRKLWHQSKVSTLETLEQDPEIHENFVVTANDMRKFKQFCTTVVADDYFSAFLDYLHSGSALARLSVKESAGPGKLMRQRSRRSSTFSAASMGTSAFSSTATKLSDQSSASEFDPSAQKFVMPSQIEHCAEGVALSHAYGVVVLQKSNHKFLARERAFFEIFHRFSTILAFITVPPQFRHQLAQEIARIGRTQSFNSQRRIQESYQDTDIAKSNSRQVYDLKEIGRSARDARIINAMNPKRKAIHPHVSVTGMTTLLSRSPMTSVKFPSAHEQLQTKLRQMEESKSLHMQSSEWSLSQKSANRPPFDPYFNCGKSVGGASQADLLAATARAGGGLPEWQESCSHQQVLSPDKHVLQRLAGPFTTTLLGSVKKERSQEHLLDDDRWMPLHRKNRPLSLQIDGLETRNPSGSGEVDRDQVLPAWSFGGSDSGPGSGSPTAVGARGRRDSNAGNMTPIASRRLQLLTQGSFGPSLGLRSPMPRIPDPEFTVGNTVETGRVPHYLVGRERSLLRQALDDQAMAADVRRMEERARSLQVSLMSLHHQRVERTKRNKKHLLLDHAPARTQSQAPPTLAKDAPSDEKLKRIATD